MKQQVFKLLTVIACMLFCINVSAYDFEVDGIYYNITSFNDKTVEVTKGWYSDDIVIPSSLQYQNYTFSVTAIGEDAFYNCVHLKNVKIQNGVNAIKAQAFLKCTYLTSIDIPNSVTIIGNYAFSECENLTSINIPNGVTEIGDGSFLDCISLTNIYIPNSVTTVGARALLGCISLTSIDIPNSVAEIGEYAFENCHNLMSINCYATTPPKIDSNTFTGKQKLFATLNIPEGCAAAYRAAEYWKDFVNIVENGKPTEPAKKCEMPTISYVAGKLKFSCNTEGAEYHYTLTDSDVKSDAAYSDGTVNLDACYKITAYATSDGCMQSEKATATLYWINANLETTNINKVQSRGVVASCNDGVIRISGLDEGETVMFYGIDGILIGSQPATAGEVMYAVGSSRNVVIAKIGDDAIKIAVK